MNNSCAIAFSEEQQQAIGRALTAFVNTLYSEPEEPTTYQNALSSLDRNPEDVSSSDCEFLEDPHNGAHIIEISEQAEQQEQNGFEQNSLSTCGNVPSNLGVGGVRERFDELNGNSNQISGHMEVLEEEPTTSQNVLIDLDHSVNDTSSDCKLHVKFDKNSDAPNHISENKEIVREIEHDTLNFMQQEESVFQQNKHFSKCGEIPPNLGDDAVGALRGMLRELDEESDASNKISENMEFLKNLEPATLTCIKEEECVFQQNNMQSTYENVPSNLGDDAVGALREMLQELNEDSNASNQISENMESITELEHTTLTGTKEEKSVFQQNVDDITSEDLEEEPTTSQNVLIDLDLNDEDISQFIKNSDASNQISERMEEESLFQASNLPSNYENIPSNYSNITSEDTSSYSEIREITNEDSNKSNTILDMEICSDRKRTPQQELLTPLIPTNSTDQLSSREISLNGTIMKSINDTDAENDVIDLLDSSSSDESAHDIDYDSKSRIEALILYICPKCGVSCGSYKNWKAHTDILHNFHHVSELNFDKVTDLNGKVIYKCRTCSSDASYSMLLAHSVTHMKHPTFKCRLCSSTFRQRDYICVHLKNKHKSVISFKKRSDEYLLHVRFHCPKCNIVTENRNDWYRHLNVEHKWYKQISKETKKIDKNAFQCNICSHKFGPLHVKKHIITHDEYMAFHCKLCDKYKTISLDSCRTHIRKMHSKSSALQCKYCDKTFKDERERFRHAVENHPNEELKCEICEKKFKNSTHLLHHLKACKVL